MTRPVRIQRKRTKGWNAIEAAGNGLPVAHVHRPLKWGNPHSFERGDPEAQKRAVERFEEDLQAGHLKDHHGEPLTVERAKAELRGKNLSCFCKIGDPCHADVLLRIANE